MSRPSLHASIAAIAVLWGAGCPQFDPDLLGNGGGCRNELGDTFQGTEPSACGRRGEICRVCSGDTDSCFEGSCILERGAVSVAAGGVNSCAVDRLGGGWCWGSNRFGLLGPPGGSSSQAVQIDGEGWTVIDVGGEYSHHACGIRDSDFHCWGAADEGQLGTGDGESRDTPTFLPMIVGATAVAVSHFNSLLIAQGRLYGFGASSDGELGLGDMRPDVPTEVRGRDDWAQISMLRFHACALTTDGTGWCWGDNRDGQLGIGETIESIREPRLIATPTSWRSISAGGGHSCGIRLDGSLWCWGRGSEGQLGLGETTPRDVPTLLDDGVSYEAVCAGVGFSCAVDEAGSLSCFGGNDNGQLAVEPSVVAATDRPRPIDLGTPVSDIACGESHVCAAMRDGRIFCWGDNNTGQTGASPAAGVAPTPTEVRLGE